MAAVHYPKGSLFEEHFFDLSKQKLQLYQSQEYSDCRFNVGDKIFHCHRVIIAAESEELIKHWKENRPQQGPAVLIPDVTPETFEAAMRFVYGLKPESLMENDFALTKNVLKFACDWKMKYLIKTAVKVCFKSFSAPSHLLELHHLFTKHSLLVEAEEIMKVICDKGGAVLTTLKSSTVEKRRGVHKDTIKALLEQDSINLFSEKDLYDAIVSWSNAQEQEADEVVSDFKELLQKIRFKAFSIEDFCCLLNEHQETDFLTRNDKHELLTYCHTQNEQKRISSSLSELDVRSGHRGRFDPISAKKVCLHGTIIPNITGTRSQNLKVSANLYLLSVWLSDTRIQQTSAEEVRVKIKRQIKNSTDSPTPDDFTMRCDQVPDDNKIRLLEPFLLEAGITYNITLVEKETNKLIKGFAPGEFGCVDYQITISGGPNVQLSCTGAGDICDFEFARPLTQNAIL